MKTFGKNTIVRVVKRLCSDKIQPNVQVGKDYYLAKDSETLEDNSVKLTVRNPDKKGSFIVMNSKRFLCQVFDPSIVKDELNKTLIKEKRGIAVPQRKCYTEEEFREKCHEDLKVMINKLNDKELAMISLVPIMITKIAFHYMEKVKELSGVYRIKDFKPIGKLVREIVEQYRDVLLKDLTVPALFNIDKQTLSFLEEHRMDFFKIEMQARDFILKNNPECGYVDMASYALIGREFINFFYEFNHKQNLIISQKCMPVQDISYPHQNNLRKAFELYLVDIKGCEDRKNYPTFDMGFTVLENIIQTSEYDLELCKIS